MRIKFIDAYFIEILEDIVIVNNIIGKNTEKPYFLTALLAQGTFPINLSLLYNKLQLTVYH